MRFMRTNDPAWTLAFTEEPRRSSGFKGPRSIMRMWHGEMHRSDGPPVTSMDVKASRLTRWREVDESWVCAAAAFRSWSPSSTGR